MGAKLPTLAAVVLVALAGYAPSAQAKGDAGSRVQASFCAPGFYSATGFDPCTAADPGSFVPGVGATAQIPCPAGRFQSLSGQSTCIPAPPGSYVPTPGQTASTPCAPGSAQPLSEASSCVPAAAGTYAPSAGMVFSIPCAPGTYQPNTGQVSCLPADPDFFVDQSGRSTETHCPVGFQSHAGAVVCVGAFVDITTPASLGQLEVHSSVAPAFACSSEVGVSSCTATAGLDGTGHVDTSMLGQHTFTVVAINGLAISTDRSVLYTVVDTTPPVITAPDVTVEGNVPGGANVPGPYPVSATDNYWPAGSISIACQPPAPHVFSIAAPTPVSCTATDGSGNVAQKTFHVIVADTTPPTFTSIPAEIEANAPTGPSTPVSFSITAADLVDGAVAPVCSPASGAKFKIGTTTVHCTATDAHGNQATASFAVVVLDARPIKGSFTCKNAVRGASTIGGSVIVPAGAACVLIGTHIHGSVQSHGGLAMFGVDVGQSTQVASAPWFKIVGSTFGSSVQIVRTSGLPPAARRALGGTPTLPANTFCGNVVHGSLQLTANLTPLDIGGSPLCGSGNTVDQSLQVSSNRAVTLSSNSVGTALTCSGNVPAPTGGGNTAAVKLGQCASL